MPLPERHTLRGPKKIMRKMHHIPFWARIIVCTGICGQNAADAGARSNAVFLVCLWLLSCQLGAILFAGGQRQNLLLFVWPESVQKQHIFCRISPIPVKIFMGNKKKPEMCPAVVIGKRRFFSLTGAGFVYIILA